MRSEFDVHNSISDVSDRTYRRGTVVSLFVIGMVAGIFLQFLTFAVFFQNWRNFDGHPIQPPRAFPAYWITVIVLALTTFGMIRNIRAEHRDGRRYTVGVVLASLSLLPLIFGIAMLAVTP